jgi:hypothetical protein
MNLYKEGTTSSLHTNEQSDTTISTPVPNNNQTTEKATNNNNKQIEIPTTNTIGNNKNTNNPDINNTGYHQNINQEHNSAISNNDNKTIVDTMVIPTPTLFSTCNPPTRSRPVYNPIKGDCYKTKISGNMRFFTQNANCLQPNSQAKWEGTLDRIDPIQIDILGLGETCVNFGNHDVTKKFKDTINRKTPC